MEMTEKQNTVTFEEHLETRYGKPGTKKERVWKECQGLHGWRKNKRSQISYKLKAVPISLNYHKILENQKIIIDNPIWIVENQKIILKNLKDFLDNQNKIPDNQKKIPDNHFKMVNNLK